MNITSSLTEAAVWLDLHPIMAMTLMLWSLSWKGAALWKAAQRGQNYWFVALLFINTVGILDIIYIFFIAKKSKVEVVEN